MTTTNINLLALNTFRAIDGLAPFADFRKARHTPMLLDYEVAYNTAASNLDKDAAKAAKKAKKDAPKAPTYKQLPHYVPSTIDSPVAFVHGFLNAHPDMKRKDAVASLIKDHGVNFSTARTQYQRWFKNQQEKATTPVAEGTDAE